MPVSDLSYITKTYIELIRRGFTETPEWTAPLPEILPVAPINLNAEGVGFHLYHVIQKKEYDSFPVPTRNPEIKFLPLALSLYYQLTANSILADENGPYNEQLMMSIAMKAIHDCPVIDDSTLTPNNTIPVMNANLRGNENRLHIVQQPVTYNEAVNNWTAGQAPMKLSAYYEVSTIFLEPDDVTSYTSRVLLYGNYILLKGAPRISGSHNIIDFKLPGETISREVKIQPAQAPPAKSPPAVVPSKSIITFFGSGFESGDIFLRLLTLRFKDPLISTLDWDIAVLGSNTINVTVREKAELEKDNSPVDILPGMYSVQIVVSKLVQIPNGQEKKFSNSSNQVPFTITPRIDSISALTGTTTTVKGYIFQYLESGNDILQGKIEVYAGETNLIRNDTGPISQGEFRVLDPIAMEINIPGTLNPGMNIPLRIVINGAESSPAWVTV